MGNVVISPDIKRTKDQIDKDGNVVRPFTKEIIKQAEVAYVPTPEELKTPAVQEQATTVNPLAAMIKEQVNKAVMESIKTIDISKLVAEAIKDAFKQ